MLITEFKEIVLIEMHRQNKNWLYLAKLIGKSNTYTRQVVSMIQNGPKADHYRELIAKDLGIEYKKEGEPHAEPSIG